MKIRTDFVTNSSSSSFICKVCGHEAIGYNTSVSDMNMVECENGHIFCKYHLIQKEKEAKGIKEKRDELLIYLIEKVISLYEDIIRTTKEDEDFFHECIIEEIKKINELIDKVVEIKIDDNSEEIDTISEKAIEYFGEEDIVSKELCPICNFDSIPDSVALSYLLKTYNINKEDIKKSLKKEFNSFEDFLNYTKEKDDNNED